MSNPLLTQFAIKVLFEELYVPAVYRVLTNFLPMYASSAVTGLVVDVGFASTQILPIFEGYPIIKASQSTPAAAALLHQHSTKGPEGKDCSGGFASVASAHAALSGVTTLARLFELHQSHPKHIPLVTARQCHKEWCKPNRFQPCRW
jgi:hypothetical protein